MKNKIIIFNPYNLSNFFKVFYYYFTLSKIFGITLVIKNLIGLKLFYLLKKYHTTKQCKIYNKYKTPIFNYVEIETINRCNNICGFCPVNKNVDNRKHLIMDDKLYRRIINQLSEINYSGEIAFHSNNEPLLDKKLNDKIAIAHKKCPNAFLYFYTNGILLDKKKVLDFSHSGLKRIVINNYNITNKLNKNIHNLIHELRNLKGIKLPQIVVVIRKSNEILYNRAGNSPNKDTNSFKHFQYLQRTPCSLPFEQLIIRPDGKISLCCQDSLGQITMGDVTGNSILDIWYGEALNNVRRKLLEKGRVGLPLCEYCDF